MVRRSVWSLGLWLPLTACGVSGAGIDAGADAMLVADGPPFRIAVVDRSGQPVAGLLIFMDNRDGVRVLSGMTDVAGQAELATAGPGSMMTLGGLVAPFYDIVPANPRKLITIAGLEADGVFNLSVESYFDYMNIRTATVEVPAVPAGAYRIELEASCRGADGKFAYISTQSPELPPSRLPGPCQDGSLFLAALAFDSQFHNALIGASYLDALPVTSGPYVLPDLAPPSVATVSVEPPAPVASWRLKEGRAGIDPVRLEIYPRVGDSGVLRQEYLDTPYPGRVQVQLEDGTGTMLGYSTIPEVVHVDRSLMPPAPVVTHAKHDGQRFDLAWEPLDPVAEIDALVVHLRWTTELDDIRYVALLPPTATAFVSPESSLSDFEWSMGGGGGGPSGSVGAIRTDLVDGYAELLARGDLDLANLLGSGEGMMPSEVTDYAVYHSATSLAPFWSP